MMMMTWVDPVEEIKMEEEVEEEEDVGVVVEVLI